MKIINEKRKPFYFFALLIMLVMLIGGCQKEKANLKDSALESSAEKVELKDTPETITSEVTSEHISVAFPFYEIKQNDVVKGYLLGAIHAGKIEMYPFPNEIVKAINQSGVVVEEINTLGFDKTKEKFYQENSFPLGSELVAAMSSETKAIFKERLAEVGLREKAIAKLNMAEITYEIERNQERMGLSETKMAYSYGVENMLKNKLTHSIENFALETLEERYQVLYLPIKEQSLEEWVSDFYSLAESNQELEKSFQNYLIGNMEANTFAYRERFPEKFTRLVDGRNQVWLPKMTMLMSENRLPFFMVGVGHFYGEGGLLTILASVGYSVEPVALTSVE